MNQLLFKPFEKENGSDKSTLSDRLKASIDELAKKNQTAEIVSAEPITTGEEDEWSLLNVSLFYI